MDLDLGLATCLAGPDWTRAWLDLVFAGPGLDRGLTGPGLGWTGMWVWLDEGWAGPNMDGPGFALAGPGLGPCIWH